MQSPAHHLTGPRHRGPPSHILQQMLELQRRLTPSCSLRVGVRGCEGVGVRPLCPRTGRWELTKADSDLGSMHTAAPLCARQSPSHPQGHFGL